MKKAIKKNTGWRICKKEIVNFRTLKCTPIVRVETTHIIIAASSISRREQKKMSKNAAKEA